jgi:hypothetical protein
MTMTLGFDAYEYLEAMLDNAGANAVLAAIAKHAKAPIRAGRFVGDDTYDIVEIDRDGTMSAPSDVTAIQTAIKKAGKYVDWPNDAAPEGVPPIILPGPGWNVATLLAEPAMKALVAEERFCRDIYGTDRGRIWMDARGKKLLAVADKHRLISVFR